MIEYLLGINGVFALEHSTGTSSWNIPRVQALLERPGIEMVTFHQCRFGLKSPVHQRPIRKSTRILTNGPAIANSFRNVFCDCSEPHQVIEGSEGGESSSRYCERYPPALCEALLDGNRFQPDPIKQWNIFFLKKCGKM